MPIHSVPFTSIPDLKKEKLRLGDDLSFHFFDNDGAVKMIVEATRLGSDKRKITGYANMDQYQILRLWAGLDRLVKERGLVDQVQTEAEYAQARREQNEACSENFSRHRQRMKSSNAAAPSVSQPPVKPVNQVDVARSLQQEVFSHSPATHAGLPPVNAQVITDNRAKLRGVLNAHMQSLKPMENRCICETFGERGEIYNWFMEVGGYKLDELPDDPDAFNTYEIHAAISADDATGLVFSLHLEHHVYESGIEDQHELDIRRQDLIGQFKAVALHWQLSSADIARGVELLDLLVSVLTPVLDELGIYHPAFITE